MNQNMAAAKDSSKLVALRRLSDAELASEIEKDGDAMTELVDAHMSHVHGLGGTEADSAAYYAARNGMRTSSSNPDAGCTRRSIAGKGKADRVRRPWRKPRRRPPSEATAAPASITVSNTDV